MKPLEHLVILGIIIGIIASFTFPWRVYRLKQDHKVLMTRSLTNTMIAHTNCVEPQKCADQKNVIQFKSSKAGDMTALFALLCNCVAVYLLMLIGGFGNVSWAKKEYELIVIVIALLVFGIILFAIDKPLTKEWDKSWIGFKDGSLKIGFYINIGAIGLCVIFLLWKTRLV